MGFCVGWELALKHANLHEREVFPFFHTVGKAQPNRLFQLSMASQDLLWSGFFLSDASFLMCSTVGMKFHRMHDFEPWLQKCMILRVAQTVAKMNDFERWLSGGAELVTKDCKNA